MAITNLFQGLGQRIGRGLTEVGGYDPMQQVSSEEAARRRQEGLSALQRSLGKSAAILSGDPRRVQFAEQQMQVAKQDRLLQELGQDPRYAEQIKLLRAGLDPRMFAPKTTKGPSSYEEYIRTDPTPTNEEYLDFLQKQKKAGATQINLDQKRDTIFAQEAAKAGFATKKEVDKQIELDKQLLSRVQMSKRLLQDGIKTGKVEEILMPLRELAIGFGIADKETINKFGQQELFQSLTNYLVPRMRVEGSGSTSDMEIDLFRSAVPNMGRTAEGNLVIAAGIENLVAYNIKRQRLMDAYLKENKNLLGFGEYADQQLGSLYKSYNSDNEFDRLVKDGVLKEGDFVYDGINGQFRVLKQEDVL
jgi:hypothetical protein